MEPLYTWFVKQINLYYVTHKQDYKCTQKYKTGYISNENFGMPRNSVPALCALVLQ